MGNSDTRDARTKRKKKPQRFIILVIANYTRLTAQHITHHPPSLPFVSHTKPATTTTQPFRNIVAIAQERLLTPEQPNFVKA